MIYIFCLPENESTTHMLCGDPIVQETISQSTLPSLFVTSNLTPATAAVLEHLTATKGAWAKFGLVPYPHILLNHRLFSLPFDQQKFILLHELRHAWQHLVSPDWKRYQQEREVLAMRIIAMGVSGQEHSHRMTKALTEIDADLAALALLPQVGVKFLREQAKESAQEAADYRSRKVTDDAMVCFDLLPRIHCLGHLPQSSCFSSSDRDFLATCRSRVLQLLWNRIPPNKNRQLKRIIDQYLRETDRQRFLVISEQLIIRLLTGDY